MRASLLFLISLLAVSVQHSHARPPMELLSIGISTMDKCQAKGGIWKASPKEGEGECFFASIELCEENGGYADLHRNDLPFRTCDFHLAERRNECLAKGGSFGPMGLHGIPQCITPTKDAGKLCTRKADCEVACLYVGGWPIPERDAFGKCASDNNLYGCNSYVEKGRVNRVCAD